MIRKNITKANKIKISLKYVTNFSPNFFFKTKNINLSRFNLNNDRINCKHFILFILMLKNVFKNSKTSLFVKPKKSKLFNILRAPYKNKMSKHQITFNRFFFNISIELTLSKKLSFYHNNQLVFFVYFLKNFYSFFESNICFQHKSSIFFNFSLNNFFLI